MHMVHEVSLACVVLCLSVACGQQNRDSDTPNRRQFRSMVQGENNPLQDLVNALQVDGMTNAELYMHYTPSTPAPQNINCYVDVPTTVRRGGQCVQLGVRGGGHRRRSRYRPWACQAGLHLEISSHCQTVMQARPGRRGRG